MILDAGYELDGARMFIEMREHDTWHNVFYKRGVHTSEASTSPTLSTSLSVQPNHDI
jgi:hypothetical protein